MIAQKLIVAVDGPAGSGKSTVSRMVASGIGLKYIDSGALYRSITLYLLERYGTVERDFNFSECLPQIELQQDFLDDGTCLTRLNGADVTKKIRDERVARFIGIVSDSRTVREFVNDLLRMWSIKESIIMDGRDIGTIVFPGADLKIYLDASIEVRAGRRINEYREMGKNVDEITVKKQIIQRDEEDRSRPFGALKQARDAVYIDTSNMSRDEVVRRIISLVKKALH